MLLARETLVGSITSVLFDRDKAMHQLKAHLLCAQQSMNKVVDKHHGATFFTEGDWVFVKLCPYR